MKTKRYSLVSSPTSNGRNTLTDLPLREEMTSLNSDWLKSPDFSGKSGCISQPDDTNHDVDDIHFAYSTGTIKSSNFAPTGTELIGCGLSICMNLVPK